MLYSLSNNWWVLFLRGLCAIAVGLLSFALPELTLLTFVLLYAIFAMAEGATAVVLGFSSKSDGNPWWSMVIVGALAILSGVLAMVWPGITAVVVLFLIATAAMMRGVVEIIVAVRLRKVIEDEWMLGFAGLCSVVFGIALMAWPAEALVVLVWLFGAYAIAFGILLVALSLRLRKVAQSHRRTMVDETFPVHSEPYSRSQASRS